MLTSWAVRKRMIDELSERPEGFKRRSLARRLTKLDKALTDLEAYSLDRAFNAWLITAGKSKSVDVSGSGIRGNEAAEPLNQGELDEIGKFRAGVRFWTNDGKIALHNLFAAMAPWAERAELSRIAREQAKLLAWLLTPIYVEDYNKGA